ncbi:hydrogenase expression/formation protein [Helicobacter sp. 13S00401-1]|uniref:HyaD/HybD family hydrogenase maturation endopeptidase n=1 Tax=Helicobacter sp. 13S00401-1 TaxID=1905758 RepID=UPI000BA69001|nr:HyaD/HybD family hydrogenase maturation endopeptidase [Helicobacter sp. 13S00401-1]PAF50138.1 hydrogenase expression/formation protein [Helicobacter sp. 13S00401-1]
MRKVLVLGIGNILFGDEGIGVHMSNFLKLKYGFSPKEAAKDYVLEFVDGGTLANALIPLISEYDDVLVLDCVSASGGAVGDVYSFNFSKIPNVVEWAGSAHEVEMLQTLRLHEMMGDLPNVHIVGIVPYVIGHDTAFTLSEGLLSKIDVMEKEVLSQLERLGFEHEIKNANLDLQEVANLSYKGF